jgi:protocatechuate 3,4-dioxygenase beta subunit
MTTRRALLLQAALFSGLPAAIALSALAQSRRGPLPPTPACGDSAAGLTPQQTEGPYFKPSSPPRTSLLEPGMAGTRLRLGGLVTDRACQPLSHVLIDVWHADGSGAYDNRGFRLRGHQFTDADGRWQVETILPGLYPGRTRHLHVKLQPQGGDILTTQLYFPNEPGNARDPIFDKRLLMTVAGDETAQIARFDFVFG